MGVDIYGLAKVDLEVLLHLDPVGAVLSFVGNRDDLSYDCGIGMIKRVSVVAKRAAARKGGSRARYEQPNYEDADD